MFLKENVALFRHFDPSQLDELLAVSKVATFKRHVYEALGVSEANAASITTSMTGHVGGIQSRR
ncbi:MAG: hypothetical protein GWP08_06685 [Nitrospiraceae bacterium]|nr:hypothetical protein [Nitrospiraceae bacterium]